MGLFKRFKKKQETKEDSQLYSTGLEATKQSFGSKLKTLFTGKPNFDDAWFDHLLAVLIQSDVSLKSSQKIIKAFRKQVTSKMSEDEAIESLIEIVFKQYGDNL